MARVFQRFKFDVLGDTQVSRAFEALASEVEDMSDPFREIGRSLISDVHNQFATEGGQGANGRWKPLNPDYEAWKRQQVGEQPILVFTGRLRSAMIDQSSVSVSPRRMVYEPNVPDYGIKHQVGDGVPQRKMIDLPETTKRDWERVFSTWLYEQRTRKGL